MSWPSPRVIAAGRRGALREVLVVEGEGNVPGFRSSTPHVFVVIGAPGALAVCGNCGTREKEPDPPGSGAPGAARTPLMTPGTQGHAIFLLTWLNRFEGEHQHAAQQ